MGTLSGLGRPTGEELIAKQIFRLASQVQLVWLTGIITRIYNPLFAPISSNFPSFYFAKMVLASSRPEAIALAMFLAP